MDPQVLEALQRDRTIDITTIGRHSGEPRRIEIWFYRIAGRYFLTGTPGRRNWYANIAANPEFTFHLKESVNADLPARGRLVTDSVERRKLFEQTDMSWAQNRNIDDWVHASPLVEIAFIDA